jgi:TetR/AcrR family transcriptional regulator of autoinduction and epiphytic fitness
MKSAVASKSPKISFKQHMLQAREEAIVQTVNRLLAEKGFDAMTVDEVAQGVGIAKASLYKHFPSKEDLAAAAMVRVLHRTQAHLQTLPAADAPLDKLKATVRWAMEVQLAGEMPSLPSQNSSLRANLMGNAAYLEALVQVSDQLGGWIEAAQKAGQINPQLPAIAVLYTLFARACDPVPGFLQASGQYSDTEIVDWVLAICFEGLNSR